MGALIHTSAGPRITTHVPTVRKATGWPIPVAPVPRAGIAPEVAERARSTQTAVPASTARLANAARAPRTLGNRAHRQAGLPVVELSPAMAHATMFPAALRPGTRVTARRCAAGPTVATSARAPRTNRVGRPVAASSLATEPAAIPAIPTTSAIAPAGAAAVAEVADSNAGMATIARAAVVCGRLSTQRETSAAFAFRRRTRLS